jgi:error-prone DNA polymerase
VRPADVTVSEWDCTLEKVEESPDPALRLGLRLVAGLSEAGAQRIVDARRVAPFASSADLAHRAALDRRDLACLAEADALAALSGHRHGAAWAVAGVERLPPLLSGATFARPIPNCRRRPKARTSSPTTARFPSRCAGIRFRCCARSSSGGGSPRRRDRADAARAHRAHRRHRHRPAAPDTASGVIFVTLEDETGATNVIVWRDLSDRQRRELLGARLLAVFGKVEREGQVVHVLAGRLADLSPMLGDLQIRSRDFH